MSLPPLNLAQNQPRDRFVNSPGALAGTEVSKNGRYFLHSRSKLLFIVYLIVTSVRNHSSEYTTILYAQMLQAERT